MKPKEKLVKETYLAWAWRRRDGAMRRGGASNKIVFMPQTRKLCKAWWSAPADCETDSLVRVRVTVEQVR